MRSRPAQAASRSALAQCQAFAELPEELVDRVFKRMGERTYEAGEALMRQGDPGDCMMIVLEGCARADSRGADGKNHFIARFERGEVVGEMAPVTSESRSADVVAESATRVLTLAADDFEDLAFQHPELGMVMTAVVAERLGEQDLDGLGGKTVGCYRIVHCLGRGAMAVVYEANDLRDGKRVALKMMSHQLLYHRGAMARFQREAEVLQKLRHRNIAAVYDRFSAYKTSFFAMEFCDGQDLAELITRQHPIPEEKVRGIIGQLAAAVRYMHGKGVIHRDLKPSNVMITRDGTLKMTDFGLVKTVTPGVDTSLTDPRTLLGTPLYMAPEQFASAEIDESVDLYALGCIAFEMLTGDVPVRADNYMELMQAKQSYVLPPADAITAGISPAMHEFLAACLCHAPEDRTADLDQTTSWAAPVHL